MTPRILKYFDMKKLPYSPEQSHESFAPEVSILNMVTYLEHGGKAVALLVLAGEVREVALALNNQNQLCYRDGNNLKLWPLHIAPRLTEAAERAWTESDIHRRFIEAPADSLTSRWPQLAAAVGGTREKLRPLFGPHLELVNEITVDFTLSRINGSAEVLASIYFNAIEQSINDCLIDLAEQGKRAGRIIAEGRVMKRPNVTRKLEERLNKRDYAFEIITEGLTFARYRVWRKSPHPVSSL